MGQSMECVWMTYGGLKAHTHMHTQRDNNRGPISPICSLDYSASRRLTLYNRFENFGLKVLTLPQRRANKDSPYNKAKHR